MKKKIAFLMSFILMTCEIFSTGVFAKEDLNNKFKENSITKSRNESLKNKNDKKLFYGLKDIDIDIPSVHEKLANGDTYVEDEIVNEGVAKADNLPKDFNAIKEMKHPQVENQSPYETCWAFSATNVLAFYMLNSDKFDYKSLDLSELQLIYYLYNRQNDPLKNTTGDKNKISSMLELGGNILFSILGLSTWAGIYEEKTDGKDYSDVSGDEDPIFNEFSKRDSYENAIAHLENSDWISYKDTKEIKNKIQENGAVGVHMYLNEKKYYDNRLPDWSFWQVQL